MFPLVVVDSTLTSHILISLGILNVLTASASNFGVVVGVAPCINSCWLDESRLFMHILFFFFFFKKKKNSQKMVSTSFPQYDNESILEYL